LISFRVFEPVNLPTVRLTHRSRRVGLFLHHYIGGIRSAVHQSPGPEHGLRHRVAGARIKYASFDCGHGAAGCTGAARMW